MTINISSKIIKSQNLKFLTFSFILHSTVILFYMLYLFNNQNSSHQEPKTITIAIEHIAVSNAPNLKPVVQPPIQSNQIEQKMNLK